MAEASIPAGLCQCGCGTTTRAVMWSRANRGLIKGQPMRFIAGHGSRKVGLRSESLTRRVCECGCGAPTTIADHTDSKTGIVRGYPNRFCAGHVGRRPIEARFWARVHKGTGCWDWLGCVRGGYGTISYLGKQVQSHRLSYEWSYGQIPYGLWVLHRCDNRSCVRPDHLFLGTPLDNNRDAINKGRNARGSKSPRAKLNESQVREILRRAESGVSRSDLAIRFGMSYGMIVFILTRRKWKHVHQ